MSAPRLSVVVVSWGRPRALARCLTALGQQRTTRAEVIVVADEDGLAAARALPLAHRMTLLPQDVQNISAARNTGIAAAAGEVVAFVDDDAVPEPGWAEAMLSAFEAGDIAAATGPVLGRNGISLQWGRMAVNARGQDRWTDAPRDGETLKLHGTNMAFRRADLTRTGGFDTGFRFFLEDTDMALRLAGAGLGSAYVPGAVVHHGFAASARRREDRVPLDLFDVGASSALFLARHAPEAREAALRDLETEQRLRLLRLVRRRKLDARGLRALMESLVAGIAEGRHRQGLVPAVAAPGRTFAALRDTVPPGMRLLCGWRHRAGALRAEAAEHVARGTPVALILLEPTPRKHRVGYTEGGWWEQTGGLYGPSDRTAPRMQAWRYANRIAAEQSRLFTGPENIWQ